MNRKTIKSLMLISLFIASNVYLSDTSIGRKHFFNLEIRHLGGGITGDITLYISNLLKDIGIDSFAYVQTMKYYSSWISYLKDEKEWDIFVYSSDEFNSKDLRQYFTENGTKNIFGLKSEIPYNLESEVFQNAVMNSSTEIARNLCFWNWERLFMDKILPIFPLFSHQYFDAMWGNVGGYEAKWHLSDSLPYMSFNGYHENQLNQSELNLCNGYWNTINPLFADLCYRNSFERLIIDLTFSPILQLGPNLGPLKTGIVEDWTRISQNHYSFRLRDNIFWNPSFNVTARNSTSESLFFIPEFELMRGIKGDFSNGTNQQITAKDAVFSLLAYSNSDISNKANDFKWLYNCYVDSIDNRVFHVKLNDKSDTFNQQYYVDFWKYLSKPILPEFFLNSSDLEICYTNGNQTYVGLYSEIDETPQWIAYKKSSFGCGKYMLDYGEDLDVTVLQKSPFWFEIGVIDGSYQTCDFETINIKCILDNSLRLQQFIEGKLDLLDVTSFHEERGEIEENPVYVIKTCKREKMFFLVFNLSRKNIGGKNNYIWLNDSENNEYTKALAIRKAICYTINKDFMNKELRNCFGDLMLCHQPNPYVTISETSQFPIRYDWNLSIAKEWMEAAGYSFDIITLHANYNFVIAVICIILISKSVYKNRIRKGRKKIISNTIHIRK